MSGVNNKKKEYPGLDVLRIICAVLVVTIHFAPFGPGKDLEMLNYRFVQYISRDAVPLFFMMSSFFYFKRVIRDGQIDMKICMSKCLSYFKQYLIWTVIYLFMIIKNYTHGRKTIIEIIRDFFFCGSYFHLWYLPALITGLIIVSYLYKSGASSKKICLISVILYVIALLGQSYYSILNGVRDSISWFGDLSEAYFKIFDTTRNGLFEGTLFATLGLMLAKQSQNSLNDKDDYNADEQISKNISGSRFGYLMIIIVLFVINMIEAEAVYRFSLAREADFYITTPIICWFIFKFAASFSLPESYNEKEYEAYRKRSYYIRNITMLVYFVQIYVGMFIKDGIGFITHKDGSSYYLFLPVLFVSILVAWMITEIKYRMTKNMQQKEYK